jgi:hypothetical protein
MRMMMPSGDTRDWTPDEILAQLAKYGIDGEIHNHDGQAVLITNSGETDRVIGPYIRIGDVNVALDGTNDVDASLHGTLIHVLCPKGEA